MTNKDYHEPVMVDEVLDALGIVAPLKSQAQKSFIDATLGNAGHTISICKSGGRVLGLDVDKEAIRVARERLEKACPTHLSNKVGSSKLTQANFKDIDLVAEKEGFKEVDGILFDLGVNTNQLTSVDRGLSFANKDAELDMRLNPENQEVKGNDLLNGLREDQLTDLFEKVLNYQETRDLVKRIIKTRETRPFKKVGDLLDIVGVKEEGDKIHPATKPFMALRMAVNSELENLEEALPKAFSLLTRGGKLAVISFHSGEDRLVKKFFGDKEKGGEAKIITKKPELPSLKEIRKNPKARSAKLRVLEKTT